MVVWFLKTLMHPITFSIAFLAPLVAQSMTAAGIQFDGVPGFVVGLAIALPLGVLAHIRGGWLWHKSMG